MNASVTITTNEHGDPLFTDYAAAEQWVGDRDDRALGCPGCHRVHYDADAFVCCEEDSAIPLVLRRGAWRRTTPARL